GSYDADDHSPILQFSGSRDTTVQGFSNTTRTSHIGGAVGVTAGTIKYVSVEGDVNGNIFDNSMSDYVGGVAGESFEGYVLGLTISYSQANVTGGTYVGGLAGYVHNDSLAYTYSSGNVIGDSYVGGLAGKSE